MQLAENALQNQEFAQAVQYYTDALSSNPDSEEAATGLEKAKHLNQQPHVEKARRYTAQGDIYTSQDKFKLAAVAFTTALTLDPTLKETVNPKMERACLKQGELLLKKGQWQEAIDWYNKGFFQSTPERKKVADDHKLKAQKALERERKRTQAKTKPSKPIKAHSSDSQLLRSISLSDPSLGEWAYKLAVIDAGHHLPKGSAQELAIRRQIYEVYPKVEESITQIADTTVVGVQELAKSGIASSNYEILQAVNISLSPDTRKLWPQPYSHVMAAFVVMASAENQRTRY